MSNLRRFFLLFCILLLGSVACRKYLRDLNTDTKALGEANAQPGALFSYAQKQLSDFFASPNVNRNIFRFFAQYISPSQYTTEARFNISSRNISNNIFSIFYTRILTNLKRAKELIEARNPENKQQLGIIGILEVYAYSFLVEIFGDIPYTDALNPENIQPAYDDAKTVYLDLANKLDEAIKLLDGGGESFKDADLVYKGDKEKWKKFGNGLKLKMALMLAKADKTKAQKMAQEASSSVFASNEESYTLHYESTQPNTNPFYNDQVYSSRFDFVGVNHFIDTLKHWTDPRLKYFFDTVKSNQAQAHKDCIEKIGYDTSRYKGATYAVGVSVDGVSQPYRIKLAKPDAPASLLDYAEVQFYLAEACCRGLINGSGNNQACDHFKNAIEASVKSWKGDTTKAKCWIEKQAKRLSSTNCQNAGQTNGCNGSSTQASTAQAETGNFNFNLAMHMWVALYNRGYAGWNVWRRFGHFPKFFAVNSDNYNITNEDIPWRFTYPIDEGNKNQANVNQAIANIGGDDLKTKLFFFK